MEHIVVTIARQYGSGGKTVGEMYAKELGIPCYGMNLLKMASEESGINEQLFMQFDEKLRNNLLLRMTTDLYDGQVIPPGHKDFVSAKNLFNWQAEVIKRLAKSETCVIIGRAADYVLKDYPNVVSVFVHASPEFNLARAMERNSMTTAEMEKFIASTDKYRSDFYKHYTGREWTDARNYDLCLNSGKLGFEKCVEEIKAYIKVRFE
ncbi:MAG: cytidylate kinase-like family protein [Ruminococcus sp.]|uniref:Cytidylate kinase-like family protein n=1 Tax=Schaedlerella arabinosiphila TaxID=2044587 RepID=N2B8R8_9FIRM|nr:cytidylate kinase-like family protein [Schaedlerella arabinosiphila]MCI8723998.1 cytidylate kinase-like family protein [Ruminococcus sp.]KAI4438848.1 Cytidylate kinase [Schaedlerella arabinosiphila]MCI9212325.1 cytidylate kinase-like family protein [Ruminococcus sp.]MCI9602911.1 cytidylate kinase-like family protein [Ruminococcus sp.]MCI9633192.1 cytidylate kinase-like family protein [Ruminococcus sp.]